MKPPPQKLLIAAAFVAVYIVWGSTYLAIKIAIGSIPPFLMASTRFLISGVILCSWARWRGAPMPGAAQWRAAAVVGTLLLLGGNGGVAWAEQYVETGLASVIIATVPVWMTLLGVVQRHAAYPRRVWVGLAVGFAGIWALVRPGASGQLHAGGIAVLLAAAFLWALGSVLAKRCPRPESSAMTVGLQMLTGGVSLLLAALLTGEPSRLHLSSVSGPSVAALAYLVLCGSLIGFTAYIWLLKVCSLPQVSTYAYVNPVVAVALGHAFAGERLSPQTLWSGAIILLGVLIVQSVPERPSGH